MPLSNTRIAVEVSGILTKALDLAEGSAPFPLTAALALLNGVGAGQADQVFADTRTLGISASEDLDIATGGGLLNAFGDAIAMARMKVLIVAAAAGNTNNVEVSRPATNGVPWAVAAGDALAIAPGEFKVLVARGDATGIVVTAATADLIHFLNTGAGTSVTYTVIIIGCSS